MEVITDKFDGDRRFGLFGLLCSAFSAGPGLGCRGRGPWTSLCVWHRLGDLRTLGHDRGAPGKGESGNCGSGPAGGRCIHASTLVRAGFTVLGLTGCMRAENVF